MAQNRSEFGIAGFSDDHFTETTKNVGAIHELPLHFLQHTQLKTAIPIRNEN